MLEVQTLGRTPVPDPKTISSKTMRRIIKLVEKRLNTSGTGSVDIEVELDEIVSGLYGLTASERQGLGMDI